MARNFAFILLASTLLAGCGIAPVAPQLTTATKASASAIETKSQVQIQDAFTRETATSVRVVVKYFVRQEDGTREFRQLILDGNRNVYWRGFTPVHFVLNGANLLQDETSLRKISRELGALNYHTTTEEQQQSVALAYEFVQERLK